MTKNLNNDDSFELPRGHVVKPLRRDRPKFPATWREPDAPILPAYDAPRVNPADLSPQEWRALFECDIL